ncbi:MAG: OmpA family protein [Pseudomonadota bacterium]
MTSNLNLAFGGLFAVAALSACNPQTLPNGGQNTRQGAGVGAAVGAVAGLIVADGDDQLRNAALGAAIGAGLGAGVGSILDRQAEELRASLDTSSGAEVIRSGDELIVRMPQDILFEVDSAEIRPDLRNDIIVLSDSLQRYPGTQVTIVGHTDNTGEAAYNQSLSERRAAAVGGDLTFSGVQSFRISTLGAGENSPIASNLSPEGRALNRRVDITIREN